MQKKHAVWIQGIVIVTLGVACGLLAWLFGFRPFLVYGQSMYPTFNARVLEQENQYAPRLHGDYLVIDILSYHINTNPSRYDVVVFKSPIEKKRYLLKRIIGLPHEAVHLEGTKVTITKTNGETIVLDEPYLNPEHRTRYQTKTVTLTDEEYFLLGDNRSNSLDSRVWGALPRGNIVGRVLLRLYPFDAIDVYPGEYQTM